jgi:hypothetical protein
MIYFCKPTKTKTVSYFSHNNKIYYPSDTQEYLKNTLSLPDIRSSYIFNKYSNNFGTDDSLSFNFPYSPTIKLYKKII